jgi:hypothetical protein
MRPNLKTEFKHLVISCVADTLFKSSIFISRVSDKVRELGLEKADDAETGVGQCSDKPDRRPWSAQRDFHYAEQKSHIIDRLPKTEYVPGEELATLKLRREE